MEDEKPEWDQSVADSLMGALILVGITYHETGGSRLEQIYGTVVSLDEVEGITLSLEGRRSGDIFRLPPDLTNICPANPGSYRLRQTGETVEDPDFTATWEVTPPR